MSSPSRPSLTALAAVGPMTWGTTYVVTTHLLPPDRPLLAGLLRALPAGLLLLAVARSLPPTRRDAAPAAPARHAEHRPLLRTAVPRRRTAARRRRGDRRRDPA